ncbi:hypothetical protein [Botrimarina sp.]|uniref:hypothetical protein n=1 Tax=Botrimarina sp. TaxID=2795802 RepID=UPI0032EB81D4
MDSEHRHELEQNELATWLADKIEAVKPYLPAIAAGLVLLIAAWIGYGAWRASKAAARADRWEDYARAVDTGMPDLPLLRQAAEENPGTAVQQWSDITWADGQLFRGANLFFQDRNQADQAIADAVKVYEELVASSDNVISGRASYQLARAYELQGELEKAREQYGRVTGAFAPLAEARVSELDSKGVKQAYEWITATSAAASPEAEGPSIGELEPDELTLPDAPPANPDAALSDLLQGFESESAATPGESSPPAESGPSGDDSPAEGEPAEGDPEGGDPAERDADAEAPEEDAPDTDDQP